MIGAGNIIPVSIALLKGFASIYRRWRKDPRQLAQDAAAEAIGRAYLSALGGTP